MNTFLDEQNQLVQMDKFKELMHKVTVNPLWMSKKEVRSNSWYPYSFEGGYVFRFLFI